MFIRKFQWVFALATVSCVSGPLDVAQDSQSQLEERKPLSEIEPPVQAANVGLAPGEELPATLAREFQCRSDQIGPQMVVGAVNGRPGDSLLIRPAGVDCRFNLIHRSAAGHEVALSPEPGGYLFSAGLALPGSAIVCTNDIQHVPTAMAGEHHIEAVVIACALEQEGVFGPLEPVIVPDGQYAAWLRELTPGSQPGTVVVRWARDFSYSVLNMTDTGRPAEDGVYETNLDLNAAAPRVENTVKVSSVTNPLAGTTFGPWKPTADEKSEYSGFIEFGPNGTPPANPASVPVSHPNPLGGPSF